MLCKADILKDGEEAIAMESDLDPQREMLKSKAEDYRAAAPLTREKNRDSEKAVLCFGLCERY